MRNPLYHKRIQKLLEQTGNANGDSPFVQISGTAFGPGTATSEQRQIAALQHQVSFLTAHVLTAQEQQSPQDEAEDPARSKLLLQ